MAAANEGQDCRQKLPLVCLPSLKKQKLEMLTECCLLFPWLSVVVINVIAAALSGHGAEGAAHGSCPQELRATGRGTTDGQSPTDHREGNSQTRQVSMGSGGAQNTCPFI